MANGKIIYTPIPTKALLLDGAHYLSLDDAHFNFGTGDFAVDTLFRIDGAIAEAAPWIVSKGGTSGVAWVGWIVGWDKTFARLFFYLNDGVHNATVYSTAGSCPADTDLWIRLEVDRDGLASFKINNVAAGGGSIAAVTGSLNNSDPLRIGGQSAILNLFAGRIDFLRIDLGRLLTAAWHVKEWDNIRYGMPRPISDFLARWNFQESLMDDSENIFTLAWQGGGSPTYVTGYPSVAAPLTYSFRRNFGRMSEGPQPNWLDTDDNQRATNGAAFGYAGSLKQRWAINFPLVQEGQLTAFKAAEASRDRFAFYADAGEPRTFWAKFGERLAPQTLMDGWYSLAMILEEV